MAFEKIAHPTLDAALKALHPSASAPSVWTMKTRHLDAAYAASLDKIKAALSGKSCTLTTDGWTDVKGKSVINYMAVAQNDAFFLESVYTGSQGHDATFLVADVRRVIKKYPFLTVRCVVTDNTSANQAMLRALQEINSRLFLHGCVAHTIHLLAKDIVGKVKWLSALAAGCLRLIKFFRKHTLLRAELRASQVLQNLPALALPVETRWGTLQEAFATVRASEPILHALVSRREFLTAPSKKKKEKRRFLHDLVRGATFIADLDRANANLELLSKFQKKFEQNATPISDVCEMFLTIEASYGAMKLPAADSNIIKSCVKARFDFVYGDAHGVAFLLDPKYGGDGMDADTRLSVENLLCGWAEHEEDEAVVAAELGLYAAHLQRLRSSDSPVAKAIEERVISLYGYWCGLAHFPRIRKFALSIFSCAATTAASERNFSTHKFVHGRLRNRLKDDRVEKLVHVFFNQGDADPGDAAFCDEISATHEESSDEEPERDPDFIYY